jgi:hypothetical protein
MMAAAADQQRQHNPECHREKEARQRLTHRRIATACRKGDGGEHRDVKRRCEHHQDDGAHW